jgi:hypothetical protein
VRRQAARADAGRLPPNLQASRPKLGRGEGAERLRDDESTPVICPTCQLAFEASLPAACYFAWGCFRCFGTRAFERDAATSLERDGFDLPARHFTSPRRGEVKASAQFVDQANSSSFKQPLLPRRCPEDGRRQDARESVRAVSGFQPGSGRTPWGSATQSCNRPECRSGSPSSRKSPGSNNLSSSVGAADSSALV